MYFYIFLSLRKDYFFGALASDFLRDYNDIAEFMSSWQQTEKSMDMPLQIAVAFYIV